MVEPMVSRDEVRESTSNNPEYFEVRYAHPFEAPPRHQWPSISSQWLVGL